MDLQVSRDFTKSDLESMLLDDAAEPRALPFLLLEEITNGFYYKQEIGRGGFAVVYKAMLQNGVVAVKRLYNTHMYENEFQREVECLMKVKHKNIVRFIGYCSDTQGNMQRYNGKLVMADVQERLLCFEYLPKGSLDGYIQDASGGLEWRTRYRIIKGICEGLHFLHHINIMHLDLKPSNILMDDNLIPKITDFGLSRSFEELQTRVIATKMCGTLGYLAPEFTSHVITHKFDLYSLGVIIMEILTGEKECQPIEDILETWDKRLALSQGYPHREQIRVCAEIGIECTNIDPAKRPVSMKHVMDRLAETKSMEYSSELLDDHPLEYRFYTELSEPIPCSLHITNNSDEHVAFRLMIRNDNFVRTYSPHLLYGGVPPRSTCTSVMTTKEKKLAQETSIDLVLQSCSISRDKNIRILYDEYACIEFLKEAKELGHAVYEVSLRDIYTPRRGETTYEPIFLKDHELLYSMDAHPTEPWFVIGHVNGNVCVWNHESKTTMDSFKISEEPVYSIKFDATKKWIVAGTGDAIIHVYDYVCVTQIHKITSFKAPDIYGGYSVGIHPTKPYVLSASMNMWDGDKGWECTHTFRTTSRIVQLTFNREDPNSFASAMITNYVQVWSLDSPTPDYTLYGHSNTVRCLDFFKRGGRQYLITGSDDCTAKIWDLQKRTCIHTIEVFMSPVRHVISFPGLPYLVTCSLNSTVQVWSSADFRLKTTVNFSSGWIVYGLVCLMGSRRIAIGQYNRISIMDIGDEEAVDTEGNNKDSECVVGQPSNP